MAATDFVVTSITREHMALRLSNAEEFAAISLPSSIVGTWYNQDAGIPTRYRHATITIYDAQFSRPGDCNLDVRADTGEPNRINAQIIVNYKLLLVAVPSPTSFILRTQCVDCHAYNYDPHDLTISCPETGCPAYGDVIIR